jgi:putative ABC transport system permease protein
MTAVFNDIKYSLRMLTKNPGFTVVAVATLALGIAVSTALFSVLRALVLDPLPYPESDRIACVWATEYGMPFSLPGFMDVLEQNTTFESLGGFAGDRYIFGRESWESVYGTRCTSGAFATLGIKPLLGRYLNEGDEIPGAARVVVLSHSLWMRSFGGDAGVIGQSVQVNAEEATVVGVMPAHFEWPSYSFWRRGQNTELWVPIRLTGGSRNWHWVHAIGRLKPGVSLEAANSELQDIGTRLGKLYTSTVPNKLFHACSLYYQMTHRIRGRLGLLFGAVILLMLVACSNVASMLLARGTQRQGEFGVRLALGAPRQSVVRMVFTETLLLGLAACLIGVLFSIWGLELIKSILPAQLITNIRRSAIRIDTYALLFSLALALITVFLTGLLPALAAARTSVQETLRANGRSHTSSALCSRSLWRLVTAQIATTLVLAHGALLLSTSYMKVFADNQALNTEEVITTEIKLLGRQYTSREGRCQFWDRLCQGIRDVPGVAAVGITTKLPLEGGFNQPILVDEEKFDPDRPHYTVELSYITPGYFGAMGIPLLSGNLPKHQDSEDSSVAVVVNRAFVEKYFPHKNPIGGRIRRNVANPDWHARVVGVVGNIRQWRSDYQTTAEIYFPLTYQAPYTGMLTVRSRSKATVLLPAIRRQLAQLDPSLPLARIRTSRDILMTSSSHRRLTTVLMSSFMGITLLLMAIGVYGSLSYHVAQRYREIGIRMALGALPRHIFNFVLSQTGLWILVGLTIGLVGSGVLSLVLRSQVYGIMVWHPGAFGLGLVIITGITLFTCLVPARRAAKTDPMEALHYE